MVSNKTEPGGFAASRTGSEAARFGAASASGGGRRGRVNSEQRELIAGVVKAIPAAGEAAAAGASIPTVNASASAPSNASKPARLLPRLKRIDRQQACLRAVDVQRWVEEDHPTRAIGEACSRRAQMASGPAGAHGTEAGRSQGKR